MSSWLPSRVHVSALVWVTKLAIFGISRGVCLTTFSFSLSLECYFSLEKRVTMTVSLADWPCSPSPLQDVGPRPHPDLDHIPTVPVIIF